MMKLNDILITKAEVENDGHQIDNEMIRGAQISVVGHFGNAVSLNIFTGSCCLLHDCNNTGNLGILIKAFVELFELTEEDGFIFTKLKDLPCRIVSDGPFSKVIGFGHFMKDRFVYTEDFLKITE